ARRSRCRAGPGRAARAAPALAPTLPRDRGCPSRRMVESSLIFRFRRDAIGVHRARSEGGRVLDHIRANVGIRRTRGGVQPREIDEVLRSAPARGASIVGGPRRANVGTAAAIPKSILFGPDRGLTRRIDQADLELGRTERHGAVEFGKITLRGVDVSVRGPGYREGESRVAI